MPHNKPALTLETCPPLRLGEDTLDRIVALEAPNDDMLSAYLDVEPSEMQREGFEAAFLDLWKPLRGGTEGHRPGRAARRRDRPGPSTNACSAKSQCGPCASQRGVE
jgi:hypothetical protein